MKFPIISRAVAAIRKSLSPVDSRRGWWPIVREAFSGAWQRNEEWSVDTVLAYHAVYSCITLISNDIGKLRPRLVKIDADGIWKESSPKDFSKVLLKPNRFQNHIQFKQWWITSKLVRGNAYALKQRDRFGTVVALYLMDPTRVQVLVAEDGGVYYQLSQDNLVGGILEAASVTVPASEVIHDRMNCLFHPLVGVSPLFASGLAASQGLKIQNDSTSFFTNGARPGGILSAPGAIGDDTATRLKAYWDANYTGENAGKVAVLGDGLKFEAMRMTAVDAQLIEQLKWTAEVVCSTFHVPPFKVGLGAIPAGQKVGDLNQIYYTDCLQSLIEEMELCLDEGLALPDGFGAELDLDGLLRMDGATQVTTLASAVSGAIMTTNEARERMNLGPLKGGDTVYMQQQDFPLDQVRTNKIPVMGEPAPPALPAPTAPTPEAAAAEKAIAFLDHIRKGLECTI